MQNFKNIVEKYTISYGEEVPGRFCQARKFDGEKYLPREENKLSSLGVEEGERGGGQPPSCDRRGLSP